MKSDSQLKIFIKKFLASKLNIVALMVALFLLVIAFLAPLLANNKPYYYFNPATQKMTYPILEDFFETFSFLPFLANHPFRYPELRTVDFRKLAQSSPAKILLPPIPYSPTDYDLDNTLVAPQIFPLSQTNHFMGTDEQGRDILSRMIHGARVSLSVGFVAVGLYVVIGIFIGSLAGYFGGKVDLILSRFIEIVICFPTFLLILSVLAFIGQGLLNIMIVIGLTSWTGIARLVRGEFLKLKNQEYVLSARALGYSSSRIIFRHILPNALSPVLVSITFGIASAILIESSLSFLGFGVQPPQPSWGDILSQSRDFMDIAWWIMFFPGCAIFIAVLSFNLIGEGVRDALDTK